MQEGYSTAPAAARALGFGAGMGLPNIKRNSDAFSIESSVGRGTRLRFSVAMRQPAGVWWERNSIRILGERCTQCLRCLPACPTQAVRVRKGGPEVLWHLCVDCTSCIEACPSGAIGMDAPKALPEPVSGTALVPSAFLAQFLGGCSLEGVLEALRKLGFDEVATSAPAESALREAVIAWQQTEAPAGPVISPVCPAVVNLVQARYPSLIPQVAPFMSPMEAAAAGLAGGRAVLVSVCPAMCTDSAVAPVSARAVRQALAPLVLKRRAAPAAGAALAAGAAADTGAGDVLEVYGIRRVAALLDSIENGLCADLTVVEAYACELGCFGSPLLWEDPFVARRRWRGVAGRYSRGGAAVPRRAPLEARQGVRLDADMARAIAKLAEIERLTGSLPGRNCSMCGAPDCATFAEDVVLGRAVVAGCPNCAVAREEGR